MKEQLEKLKEQIEMFEIKQSEHVEAFRLKFLTKKSELNDLFEQFKLVPADIKKEMGSKLNQVKQKAQQKWEESQSQFESIKSTKSSQTIDYSLGSEADFIGVRHPLSIIENEIIEIFKKLGFVYSEGPEIEDDWHNFSALNFPPNHPARDMQDTFFISENIALRTHTSSVQVRLMENQKPPIRAIMPGRVYRNEAISARANCFFHQIEGIYIDEKVSFADLKQTLFYFVQELFGQEIQVRFRPSYFPFTEPSAEMDISCLLCKGKGCNVCKYTGFLEILGCGMIDPNVLEASGIDSKKYSGFAFGMGIERIAMLKYEVKDLRTYFNNDTKFLSQFESQ
ncbi:MAG: phenylalanine--tRNA ligase subunit alpha [Bacteroidia bacterium]|nr:phenylalanine--tRNA ligase subunit alpha [Bacteroidia bacterium]MCF8426347.1 phenylalanine--tRNA ligase subunit alpha [Bacteroidia bacterium]MCF8445754.1 phenylalanine--tRNA ligase subunit alpha [Bacteroidia bacterium]